MHSCEDNFNKIALILRKILRGKQVIYSNNGKNEYDRKFKTITVKPNGGEKSAVIRFTDSSSFSVSIFSVCFFVS